MRRRLLRFAIVGLALTVVHIGITMALIQALGASQGLANSVAFASCTVLSYIANALWTFGASPAADSLGRFVSVAVLGLGATALVAGTVERLGGSPGLGILAVIGLVTPFTFLLHALWTFRRPDVSTPTTCNGARPVER